MTDQIFVALLNEGIDVWRPVSARKLRDSTYNILPGQPYDPSDETWQFPPGSIVVCEPRATANGTILAAIRLKDQSRKTA